MDDAHTILVIASDGYFRSKNCMRELVASVSKSKPLITLAERDPKHGGLTEGEARQQCIAAQAKFETWGLAGSPEASELSAALFDAAAPIVFERVGVFQQPMLRLIVERLLPVQTKIYLPGEVRVRRRKTLAPPTTSHHVWCSRHNPGVREVLAELADSLEGQLLVADELSQMTLADHVLLYLNLISTWPRGTTMDQGRRRLRPRCEPH